MSQITDLLRLENQVLTSKGTSIKDVFVASLKSVWAFPKNIFNFLKEKIQGAVDYAMNPIDDNIHVRADQETVLGTNFRELFMDADKLTTRDMETVDANGNTQVISYLDFAKGSREVRYLNEMHGSNLTFSESTDFSAMIPTKRVGYEMTLITKKYAQGGTLYDANGSAISYQDVMSQYQNYCEQNNISWVDSVWVVSEELQHETRDASGDLGSAFGVGEDASTLRYIANTAHNLILTVAGPEYQDMSISGIDYEQTLDVSAVPYGFFRTKINSIQNATANMQSPFQAVRDNVYEYLDNVSAASAAIDVDKALNHPEYYNPNASTPAPAPLTSQSEASSTTRYEQSCSELGVEATGDGSTATYDTFDSMSN